MKDKTKTKGSKGGAQSSWWESRMKKAYLTYPSSSHPLLRTPRRSSRSRDKHDTVTYVSSKPRTDDVHSTTAALILAICKMRPRGRRFVFSVGCFLFQIERVFLNRRVTHPPFHCLFSLGNSSRKYRSSQRSPQFPLPSFVNKPLATHVWVGWS